MHMRQARTSLQVFLRTHVRKQFSVFVAVITMFVGFFGNMGITHALAPASISMGSNLAVAVGSSGTVPTLTFTDNDTTPSVTATNDLYIKIPAGMNAVWDQTATTLTYGGTASALAVATPVYMSTTVVKIDILGGDFVAGDTLTIAGLKIYGATSANAIASIFSFSVDGGSTYAPGRTVPGSVTTTAATMTTVQTPTVNSAYALTTYTFAFTTVAATPLDGLIKMVFPANVDLTNVTATDGTCSTMNGSFSTGVALQTVTITRSAGAATDAGAMTCTIANVRNYIGTTGTGTFKVETSAGENGIIETSTVAATTYGAGSLDNATVSLADAGMSATGVATLRFTNVGALPGGAKILFTFPAGFSIGDVTAAACTNISGLTPTVSGNTVTFTRSPGLLSVPAAHVCTIPNVTNPNKTGTTDYFTLITTTTSDAVIDQSTTVQRVDILPIGVSPQSTIPGPVTGATVGSAGGDGTSAILRWTNPVVVGLLGVHVYRSEQNNVLGALVGTTNAEAVSFTDTGLVVGKTYFYILRPFTGSGDNQNSDILNYTATKVETPVSPPPENPPAEPEQPVTHVDLPVTPDAIAVGDVVRGDADTVYYIAANAKRYVFPNVNVFNSWYKDFSKVKKVQNATLMALPLGGTVRLRSGVQLVKIVSDPKVYAIEPGGVLRWVSTEALANTLYGATWSQRVQDVDVSLFVNYSIGAPVVTPAYPVGSVVRVLGGDYFIIGQNASGTLYQQKFVSNGLIANRYNDSDSFSSNTDHLLNVAPVYGPDISSEKADIANPIQ